MKPPRDRPMASPTNPAMMPVTMTTRWLRVEESIWAQSPAPHAISPVAVATMCIAGPGCAFRTTRPRTNETRPSTSTTTAVAFSTGWGRPSVFRMLSRWLVRVWPAMVTTSRCHVLSICLHGGVFPAARPRNPQLSLRNRPRRAGGSPAVRRRFAPDPVAGYACGAADDPVGTSAGLYPRHLLPRNDRGRISPEEAQDAHAPLRDNDHPRPQPRGAHRTAVARPVPEGRDRRRRQGKEGKPQGQSPSRLPDREEVRGHLRRRRPDRRARHRAGTRPPAQPQRGHPADQGHAARAPPLSRSLSAAFHAARSYQQSDIR